jgi:phage terminase large subunit-like protein
MGRATVVLFAWMWAAVAASFSMEGEALFRACEFKAAYSFEHALTKEPGNALLHFWLGKSYARMAEASGPFSARRNARRAQAHLETAIRLDPRNRELLMELFELYGTLPD